MNIVYSLLGLFLLVKGANYIVGSSLSFASRYSLNSIIVGLTLVAFGTSAPEMAINLSSNIKGVYDVAFSDIFGSSIFNNFLVLGIVFYFSKIRVNKRLLIREMPFGVASATLLIILLNDTFFTQAATNTLTRADGLSLLLFFVIFVWVLATYKEGFFEHHQDAPSYSMTKTIFLFLIGLFLVAVGSHILIDAVIQIANNFSLSFKFLGVSLVAFSTSAPELATAYYAIKSGHTNLIFGNIVGSNIFNILFILGVSSTFAPMQYNAASLNTDLFIVLFAKITLILMVLLSSKKRVLERKHGVFFLTCFVCYLAYLFTQTS